MDRQQLITVSQAAEISKYSAKHIRHLCATGKIEGAVLMGKTWVLPAEALDAYIPGAQGFAAHPRRKSS